MADHDSPDPALLALLREAHERLTNIRSVLDGIGANMERRAVNSTSADEFLRDLNAELDSISTRINRSVFRPPPDKPRL